MTDEQRAEQKRLEEAADTAVDGIVADLRDRSGLGDEWDQIGETIRQEIREQWSRIIHAAIASPKPAKKAAKR